MKFLMMVGFEDGGNNARDEEMEEHIKAKSLPSFLPMGDVATFKRLVE